MKTTTILLRPAAALALGLLVTATDGCATATAAPLALAPVGKVQTLAPSHLIVAGDRMMVHLGEDGGLSDRSVKVDAAGDVFLPLIGKTKLAGLTLATAENALRHAYAAESGVNLRVQMEFQPDAGVSGADAAHSIPVNSPAR